MRVGDTRVTLETVIGSFNDGAVPEEIVLQYPALTLTQVYQVIAFYLANQADVDAYMNERALRGEEMKRNLEAQWPKTGLRGRMLARARRQEK